MYGPHLGSGEVLDILQDVRDQYPDARIHLDIIGVDGLKRAASTYSPTSFEFDTICEQYGQGEYRVRVQATGQPKPVKMFRFLSAPSARSAPAPLVTPPPAPVYPPAYMYHQAPPPPPQHTGSSEMMQFVLANMQQQQQMVTMLLGKLIEQRTAPQEPAKISELKELLQLADRFSRRRGGGESEGADDGLLGGLGKLIMGGLSAQPAGVQAAPSPAMRPVRPVAAQVGGMAPPRHFAGAASRPPVTPEHLNGHNAAAPVMEPLQAPPPHTTPGPETAPAQASPAQPAPAPELPPAATLIAQALRHDASARRLAKLIMVEEHDDADGIADMAEGAMSDDAAEAFLSAPAGNWSALFLAAFPEVLTRRDLVERVESSLRDLLSDDDQAGGGSGAEADADQAETTFSAGSGKGPIQ